MTQPLPDRRDVTGSRLTPVPAAALPPVPADDLLGETEGYLVDAAAGVVGVVEEVVFDARGERPEFLMVRREGLNRQRALEVPVQSVVEVHPAERRIVLGGYWRS